MTGVYPGEIQQPTDTLSVAYRRISGAEMGVCSAQNPGRCLCTASTCGAGLLDAEQALRFALDPAAYVAPVRAPVNIDSADVTAAVALGLDRDANAGSAGSGSSGGGGGAMNPFALLGLSVIVIALLRRRAAP